MVAGGSVTGGGSVCPVQSHGALIHSHVGGGGGGGPQLHGALIQTHPGSVGGRFPVGGSCGFGIAATTANANAAKTIRTFNDVIAFV